MAAVSKEKKMFQSKIKKIRKLKLPKEEAVAE